MVGADPLEATRAAGLAVDRFGVARSLLTGSLALAGCTYALYWYLASGGGPHFVALYALAGFFCGVVGVVPALMVAAFPPVIRFSGLSFSYNVAYAIFGGLTPPLIGYLSKALGGLAPAHYVAFTCLVGMGVAMYLIARRPPSY